jgi:hypothetical protein
MVAINLSAWLRILYIQVRYMIEWFENIVNYILTPFTRRESLMSMSKLKFNLVVDGDESQITLFHDGKTYQANTTHPNWNIIQSKVLSGDVSAIDHFSVVAMFKRMRMSERVLISNGKMYFDNDEVHDAMVDHILRILGEDEHDPNVKAWVAFFENVQQNPNEHSREHLFRHLEHHRYTITHDGMLVGYKGVYPTDDGYESSNSGPAIVNGEIHTDGRVPNKIGSIIEMARSKVRFDPGVACSTGLHVGNWRYASTFASKTIEVHVNPRDVVSVPVSSQDEKIRCCRYKVIRAVTEPYRVPVLKAEATVTVKGSKLLSGGGATQEDLAYAKAVQSATVKGEPAKATNNKEKDTVSATATRIRYPRPADYETLVSKAKRQKKGAVTFIQKQTSWTLLPGRTGLDRKDWAV